MAFDRFAGLTDDEWKSAVEQAIADLRRDVDANATSIGLMQHQAFHAEGIVKMIEDLERRVQDLSDNEDDFWARQKSNTERIEKLEKDTKLHYAGDDYARTSTEDGHTDEQPDDDWHCPHCWSTKGTWFDRTI